MTTDQDSYDVEWQSSDIPDTDGNPTSFREEAASSENTYDGSESTPSEVPSPDADQVEDDIWRTAPEALREQYEKVNNDFNSMKGRHKAAEKRAADLQRSLEQEATTRSELEEKTRRLTSFETDHPDYSQDVAQLVSAGVQKEMKSREQAAATAAKKGAEENAMGEILSAHSDALVLYRSPEFAAWVKGQSLDIQDAVQGDSPQEIIQIFSSYKSSRPPSGLEQISSSSNSRQSAPRASGRLSDDESYRQEWESSL